MFNVGETFSDEKLEDDEEEAQVKEILYYTKHNNEIIIWSKQASQSPFPDENTFQ